MTERDLCAAYPKAKLTRKIESAPPIGCTRLSTITPMKYHPGMCRTTNMREVMMLAVQKGYRRYRLPRIAPLMRNSSSVGAIMMTFNKEKLILVGSNGFP